MSSPSVRVWDIPVDSTSSLAHLESDLNGRHIPLRFSLQSSDNDQPLWCWCVPSKKDVLAVLSKSDQDVIVFAGREIIAISLRCVKGEVDIDPDSSCSVVFPKTIKRIHITCYDFVPVPSSLPPLIIDEFHERPITAIAHSPLHDAGLHDDEWDYSDRPVSMAPSPTPRPLEGAVAAAIGTPAPL